MRACLARAARRAAVEGHAHLPCSSQLDANEVVPPRVVDTKEAVALLCANVAGRALRLVPLVKRSPRLDGLHHKRIRILTALA